MTSDHLPHHKPHYNKPLRPDELQDDMKDRLGLIQKEFTEGLQTALDYPRSVTIFGGARMQPGEEYYEAARRLAHKIVKELDYAVVTGGGPGIMEAGNRGANEAGGHSIGLTIDLPFEQATNAYVTDEVTFNYFFARKVSMTFSAEAYIYFPGGFGTLDELFEIVTLVQTEKIDSVPVILYGSHFWKPLIEFFKNTLLTHGTIDETDLELITITDDQDEIVDIVRKAPVRISNEFNHR